MLAPRLIDDPGPGTSRCLGRWQLTQSTDRHAQGVEKGSARRASCQVPVDAMASSLAERVVEVLRELPPDKLVG
jgi:hypothetical protein